MKNFAKLLTLVVTMLMLSAFGGCVTSTTTSTLTPQAAVYQAKQNYEVALQAALLYEALPECGSAGATQLCSSKAAKLKIKQAKDVASPSLDAAEASVRNPDFDKSTATAVIVSANAAVAALAAIVAALPHK